MRDRLVNPAMAPSPELVAFASAAVRDMLRVRRDTPLFRLRSSDDILDRADFHLTGPDAPPGVIVMTLRDDGDGLADLDPAVDHLLVVINASPTRLNFDVPGGAERIWWVHPTLAAGADAHTLRSAAVYPASGRATVPPLTTAVFVAPRMAR